METGWLPLRKTKTPKSTRLGPTVWDPHSFTSKWVAITQPVQEGEPGPFACIDGRCLGEGLPGVLMDEGNEVGGHVGSQDRLCGQNDIRLRFRVEEFKEGQEGEAQEGILLLRRGTQEAEKHAHTHKRHVSRLSFIRGRTAHAPSSTWLKNSRRGRKGRHTRGIVERALGRRGHE